MENTFKEVLNRLKPEITAEPEPGRKLELDIAPPTFNEVKADITSLKNDKKRYQWIGLKKLL